jgi:hypothetical protein
VISNSRPTPFLEENEKNMIIEEPDPAATSTNTIYVTQDNIIQLEHHIVYSTSYQVPVLYFKASYQGNKAPPFLFSHKTLI